MGTASQAILGATEVKESEPTSLLHDFMAEQHANVFARAFSFAADQLPAPPGVEGEDRETPIADRVMLVGDLGFIFQLREREQKVSAKSGNRKIRVLPFFEPAVVVSFSNLCSTPTPDIQNDYVDTEFASYYNVFLKPPPKLYLPHLKSLALPSKGEPLERNLAHSSLEPIRDWFDRNIPAARRAAAWA